MTVLRAPPGVQVSSGRIRVDAAKAIAKLRAYRLADPTAWILEAVRAAVASGATRILLDGDSDDLWLRWDGPPWSGAQLADLFDELVSPEPAHGAYHRRLLAAAVNSALGLDAAGLEPAWVDVIAIDGAAAHRVRFTPAVVADDEDGATLLRQLAAEPVAMPEDAGTSAVILHVRRPFGLRVISRFVRGAELPELTLARAACADLAVPMTIGGAAVGRDQHTADLVREPLGEGLDGWVALVDPRMQRGGGLSAQRHVAELGVRISSEPWSPAEALEAVPAGPTLPAIPASGEIPRPLRLLIDGRRMPTNASRSQVDAKQHPLSTALEMSRGACQRLLERLAREEMTEARRGAVLALLAAEVAGAGWSARLRDVTGPLAALAALALVRNAVGAWRPLTATWGPVVYTGDEALPAELTPWLETTPWMPAGDPARLLFGDHLPFAIDRALARAHIKDARQRHAAHQRFLRHPPRTADVVPRLGSEAVYHVGPNAPSGLPSGDPAEELESCVPDAVFEGLRGSVCVMPGPKPGRVLLLLEGRPLDTVPIEAALSIEAVVDGAPLTPDASYRRAVDDDARERAITAARCAAVRAVEAQLRAGAGGAGMRGVGVSDALVWGALVMVWHSDQGDFEDGSPLLRAAVWSTVDGHRRSIVELRQERAVGVCDPQDEVAPLHGRSIVIAAGAAREALSAALEPATMVVRYGEKAARPPTDPAMELGQELLKRRDRAVLVVRETGRVGAISFGEGPLVLHHRGVKVADVTRKPALLPCSIAVDCDGLVPGDDWDQVRDDGGAGVDLDAWERALIQAATRAVLGERVPDLMIPDDGEGVLDERSCRALFAAIAANLTDVVGVDLVMRLRQLPMLRVLGRDEAVSVHELRKLHDSRGIPAIARVGDDVDVEALEGWAPLVAGEDVRALVRRLSGRPVWDAEGELRKRRETAARASKLERHRKQAAEAVKLPPSAMSIATPALARGRVGLAPAGAAGIELHIAFEGRRISRVVSAPDLALAATAEVELDDLDGDVQQLTEKARTRLLAAVRAAVGPLIMSIARSRPEALMENPAATKVLVQWLGREEARTRGPVHEVLRHAAIWPTPAGKRVSLSMAARGPMVPVVRAHASDEDAATIVIPDGDAGDEWILIMDAIGPWSVDDVTATVLVEREAAAAAARTIAAVKAKAAAKAAKSDAEPETDDDHDDDARERKRDRKRKRKRQRNQREAETAAVTRSGAGTETDHATWPWWTPPPPQSPQPPPPRSAAPLSGVSSEPPPTRPTSWADAGETRIPLPPLPVPPPPPPPTPMRKLAGALRARLVSLASAGVFIERVDVVDHVAAPLVRANGNDLILAGDAAALRDLAAALADEHPAAPAGIDALAAHALTVLNAAHETVTDDVERAGLGHLLARPGS